MVKVIRETSSAKNQLEIAFKNLEGKVAKVGWFEKSKYEDGTPVASVAVTQEYGNPAKNIPPRPFMRPTIIAKETEWRRIAESGALKVLRERATIADVMEGIGLKAAADIRKTISLIWEPPLSPVTIYARLRKRANHKITKNLTKPLIDTGIMFGTLTNTVENE